MTEIRSATQRYDVGYWPSPLHYSNGRSHNAGDTYIRPGGCDQTLPAVPVIGVGLRDDDCRVCVFRVSWPQL